MTSYKQVYENWQRDPEGFWRRAASAIDWFTPCDAVFDAADGPYGRWFAGAKCNTAFNCVDRHILLSRGEWPAIIYDSPLADSKRTITYAELA